MYEIELTCQDDSCCQTYRLRYNSLTDITSKYLNHYITAVAITKHTTVTIAISGRYQTVLPVYINFIKTAETVKTVKAVEVSKTVDNSNIVDSVDLAEYLDDDYYLDYLSRYIIANWSTVKSVNFNADFAERLQWRLPYELLDADFKQDTDKMWTWLTTNYNRHIKLDDGGVYVLNQPDSLHRGYSCYSSFHYHASGQLDGQLVKLVAVGCPNYPNHYNHPKHCGYCNHCSYDKDNLYVASLQSYQAGKQHGLTVNYYASGHVESCLNYDNGHQHGIVTHYYDDDVSNCNNTSSCDSVSDSDGTVRTVRTVRTSSEYHHGSYVAGKAYDKSGKLIRELKPASGLLHWFRL